MLKRSKDTPSHMFLHSTRWIKNEILMKVTQMLKKNKIYFDERNYFDEKFVREQTSSKPIRTVFFFLFSFDGNFTQLKCVKIFIKITSLIDFDENFDAFATALTLNCENFKLLKICILTIF